MNKYQREIEKLLAASERNISRELQQAYKDLADDISKEIIQLQQEIDETDKFPKKLQKERLEAIRNQMDRKINVLEQDQKSSIWSFLRLQGDTAYNSLFYDFEMSNKIPLAFSMLTDKQINVIINTPVASRRLSTRLAGNATKMKKNLNRVLVHGFGKGLSTQKMARQIADIGGAEYRRAMNIVRTESGRVTGVTTQQSQQHAKEIGLRVQKKWVSTLDGKTRTNHRELDGQVREIDERFTIGRRSALQPHMFGVASEDCNCRCFAITIILGYEPDLRRDNESHEVMDYESYNDWLAAKKAAAEAKAAKEAAEKAKALKEAAEKIAAAKDPAKRISFLEKEMEKLENDEWGDLTEEQAEKLYDSYYDELAKLKQQKIVYNVDEEFTADNPTKIKEFFEDQEAYQNWIGSLDEDSKKIIYDYTSNDYKNFNQIFREGEDAFFNNPMYQGTPEEYRRNQIRRAKELSEVINGYSAERDFVTYRRIAGSFEILPEIGVEDIFDDGFMSTSLLEGQTKAFGGSYTDILYKIHVKKGSNVGSYVGELSRFKHEQEFLIKPGTKFKVIGSEVKKNGDDTIQILELETI